MQFHHQYRAPPPPRSVRQFTQLGIPLSRAFQRLVEGGLIAPLPPRPLLQPTPQDSGQIFTVPTIREQAMIQTAALQPISLYEESDFVRYIPRQQIPRPFSFTPDKIYGPPPISPVYLQHVPPMTPFILFLEEYRPPHRDVQIVTRSGRVAQPPPVDRPFAGIAAREEVQREDDEILRQLRTTQARISIWGLLASSSTHRDALVRALGQIQVDTATTPEGLIHMLTADRATCIVFSDDDLPPEGSNHVRPLFIDVICSGRRVPSVRLDNGSALNVCPLVTAIALGFLPADFRASSQIVRAYDGTQRTVMGFSHPLTCFLVAPWIHEACAIPSSLHQKVKFIHEGRIIMIQSDKDIITSSKPVLHISHSENDLHLTGFTFDEVQVVSLEDGSRDMDSYALALMQIGNLRIDSSRWGCNYGDACFPNRGSEHTPRTEGTVRIPETVEIQDIQQALGQMHLDTGTTETPGAMIVAPPSPTELVCSLCVSPRGPYYDLPMDLGDGTDEMDMIGIGRIGRILDAAPRGPHSAFDISGVSVLDDESVLDVVTSDFTSVEGASDSVDPPLSSDTMSGFVTRFDAPTIHIYDVDDVGDTDDPLDDQPREIRIGSSLSLDERSRLIDLLRSYLDAVKQKLRRLHPRWSLQVKEEIRKQLSVGFLSVVEYPEWLANVIPVPKKDGKGIRCCPSWMAFLGATYQRAATTLFHDMMHTDVETVQAEIESQEVHLWGSFGKLMGHIVSERGIEIDPEKIRAILDMPTPRTEKEIKGFLGKLQYISRFIARLTDICEPIFCLLRKNQPTIWSDDCQRAFERIKEYLLSPPVLVPPTLGRPLLLYLSVSDMALGCMLAQLDDLGKERAIYYLSKRMLEYECKYIMIERLCLALACSIGRLMRWLVLLTEFDIHYVTQKSVKGSIVADHLASLPISDDKSVDDDFPDEQIVSMTSLETALDLGIRQLEIHGDSNLVIQQLKVYTSAQGGESFCRCISHRGFYDCDPRGRSPDDLLLLCLDCTSADRVMREVHAGRCQECQMHGDLIHVPPSELHALTSPWPFSVWGVDIIGKISPKSSSGHEYILVAIDYFTKGEVDTLIQEYGIQHHRSSTYRPQTNGAVEASNKNIKRILRKMVETSRDCYPYSLVYGMEVVLPVEIEMRSLRVALEQHVSEAESVQSRYDQLSLLDEKRLRAADHAQAYQRKVSITSGDIEGHILSFHSVYLPQARDQRQMLHRVGTIEGTFTRCFDMFILGHAPILACWLWFLYMYASIPFHLAMLWTSEFE
ncbi:Retrovirus-related Pol polyprotein from transposon opus [Vitis vinifera]|uniref:Retrovirus-related Pol polyprotein from transposon opus n=1 Tax=Vitis vinifera TaxID=29760 RepID=A0A438I7H1_VITVI|nr:Retrovirus-related Pol polyprotein from transposon opus [Vitis vinifera]